MTRLSVKSVVVCCFAAVTGFGFCRADVIGAPQDADAPCIHVQTVSGEHVAGAPVSFDLARGFVIASGDGARRTIATEDVICATLTPRPTESDKGSVEIKLAGGNVLHGTLIDANDGRAASPALGSAGQQVHLASPLFGQAAVPLERVTSICFDLTGHLPELPADSSLVETDGGLRLADSANHDVIVLANGDFLEGWVAGIDATGVNVEIEGEQRDVPFNLISAAYLQAEPASSSPGIRAVVELSDGSRITTESLALEDSAPNGDRGPTLAGVYEGSRLAMPLAVVKQIDIRGGRWRWLDEIEPADYEQTPASTIRWDYNTGRNVLGGPLRVGPTTFKHGIGVHSRAVLVYDLPANAAEFVARYGLDDSAGRFADVEVLIRVDDQQRYRAVSVTSRDGLSQPVRIDVAGARRLELVVDFGRNAAVQDRFDWIRPAIVLKPASERTALHDSKSRN